MPTRVYLIRHGITVDAHEKRYKGHIDVPLSDEGIRQAGHTAGFIKNLNWQPSLSRIFCSGLSRAITTAETVGRPFGITPEPLSGLCERHFGQWEGMTFDEIKAAFPEEFANWAGDPLNFSPVGGESTADVSLRVMPVFYDIVSGSSEKTIAVVAHGGVNRIILCDILGIPLSNIFRVEQDFACLNIIDFYDGVSVVKLMNWSNG
ncbi:MAG: histidine phosphatase family protein [Candidatus Magnetominusculus sp. LBB02]|nr:histidine phosphatase family protein [Candidatus Magnetominusculus sp. LBB02]